MSGYISHCINKFQHDPQTKPQHPPHHHTPIVYGKKGQVQYANEPDLTPKLNKNDTKKVQSITGSLLYHARAIDGTLLLALNDNASQQAQPTEYTMVKCKRLLDYVSTYPNVTIRYHASNIKFHIDSDAAYLVMPKARSRVAGFFNLGQPNIFMTQQQPNGAI